MEVSPLLGYNYNGNLLYHSHGMDILLVKLGFMLGTGFKNQ